MKQTLRALASTGTRAVCHHSRPILGLTMAFAVLIAGSSPVAAQSVEYLSHRESGISLTHRQDWGDFGIDTAAAATGQTGSPMQIGETKYARGLGHHANGEIVVDLQGQFTLFRAQVGVQWQGGHRGSVVFRIAVDGRVVWETGPMSDSDPPRSVEVPLDNARELRLMATDAGDGIGCDMANWAEASLVCNGQIPRTGACAVMLAGEVTAASATSCGFSLVAKAAGPQVAVLEPARELVVAVDRGEEVRIALPVKCAGESLHLAVDASLTDGAEADVELSLAGQRVCRGLRSRDTVALGLDMSQAGGEAELVLTVRGTGPSSAVRWSRLRYTAGDRSGDLPFRIPTAAESIPPPVLPELRPAIERELIEWDWRLQDGIGTAREARTYREALEPLLQRGTRLCQHLAERGVSSAEHSQAWDNLQREWKKYSSDENTSTSQWQDLWQRVHLVRRQIVLHNPLAQFGPLVFAKHVPSSFSHQLTQYSGACARPGGGLFVLDAPGQTMRCRPLAQLPPGSYLQLDVSWDGRHVLFAYCETDPQSIDWRANTKQFYHLFEIAADGSALRQLTNDACDDFSPRYLPNGQILFLSTRRGGFHRCGRGPCPVHTMTLANGDGSDPRVISFHETHEWDPAVLNDGRIIYTRWDYVDRHAVYYQQLWTVRPDGSEVRAFYGNNTLNPVGVWEARPVPGSERVMATAAAHHAMTAGSIILLDVSRGVDGLEPITRLTEDALFPESEFPVGSWSARAGVPVVPDVPVEERRWPGHCYRTPYPLSEDFFLAAYSFEPLIGEPFANQANMFGIYLVDRFGNKELLYRDPSIGSLWPMPLRARPCPPAIPSTLAADQPGEGTFLLQNVYESWPDLTVPRESIKRLRILQVLPKTTPNANTPRVGLANASPGKQVLGTVPVESDGSAYFRAPAGIPLAFQALDERGMAVQTMRSLTYLQPGEQAGCVGCHEHRTRTPAAGSLSRAGQRPPSTITPGPAGSRPFNYAILVQPVLDRQCVSCHEGPDADGGVDLSGAPAGEFTVSYNALAPRVPFSEWKGTPQDNAEPLAGPNVFGARASSLMALLTKGHEDVSLSNAELECLVTWMDTNALFYGTFSPEDQKRQQQGELIAGPALE